MSNERNCNTCAHKEYCPLGGECSNEGYLYFMGMMEVKNWDGEPAFYSTQGGGWL